MAKGRNKVMEETAMHLDQPSESIPEYLKNRLQLQGQCRISKVKFLTTNIPKAILLTILAICSIFGLLLIAWYKWFRVKIWYSECNAEEATHAYIEAEEEGVDDIQVVSQDGQMTYFYFKKLRYEMIKGIWVPVGFDYRSKFQSYISDSHLKKGLDEILINAHRRQFGKNEHPVQIPNYFSFMGEILLKPFFLMQYLVCIAFVIQRLEIFAILNLFFSLLTTTINYIYTYISFKKIKDMAEKVVNVRVLRDKQMIQIRNFELLPGDLIDPEGEIPCDCILIRGEIYVNQASLTGQNFPIAKFPAVSLQETKEDNRWLYEGAKVLQKKGEILALVVNIGYTTRRGRIIRKILTKVPTRSDLFNKALLFLLEAFIIASIIYFACLTLFTRRDIDGIIIGFRFIDFLGWSFPPTFPIYFNLAYSFAMSRLRLNNINGTQPEKTVQGSNLTVMCFDKTGTLTENLVQVNRVMRIKNADIIIDITDEKEDSQNDLVFKLFATCHTAKKIDNQWMGDEVDLRMYLFSDYTLEESSKPEVKFIATHEKKKIKLEVLRINQFESKFQSMSVLVRDCSDEKIYAFIKGAPEKIERNSVLKAHDYNRNVSSFSLGGYRTIGCGYRVIEQNEFTKYLEGPREIFQQKITALGLIAFQNKLKSDTRQTIERLKQSGIQSKIITGDNIFIAVQTGVRAGILDPHEPVILLQGKKQSGAQHGIPRLFKGILLTRHGNETKQQPIELQEDENYITQNHSIAIDNDFLTLDPPPPFTDKIKLFARISPENKAAVVVKFKQIQEDIYKQRSWFSKLIGPLKGRIGMCGDGANDLMAIRQSDVGIGINDSDASYGASFTIVNMLDIDYIIRDSKATTCNIIEMIRYYEFISFLKIPASLLLVTDTAYWNLAQLLYYNFTSTVIYPIFMALGKPSEITTKQVPRGNFMGAINHLRFWGSLIFATGGLVGGFYYIKSTPNWTQNQVPEATVENSPAWHPLTQSATAMFLMVLVHFTMYGVFFYISQPWKMHIYRNLLFFIIVILNVGGTFAQHYMTKITTKALGVWPIDYTTTTVLLAISSLSCIVGYIYNQIIDRVEQETNIN